MTDDNLTIRVVIPLHLEISSEVHVTEDELLEYLDYGAGPMRTALVAIIDQGLAQRETHELTFEPKLSGKDYDAFRERRSLRHKEKQYLPISDHERELWQRIRDCTDAETIVHLLGAIYQDLYIYLEENPDCKGPRREDIDNNLKEIGATLYGHSVAPWSFSALNQHLGHFSRYLRAFPIRQGC